MLNQIVGIHHITSMAADAAVNNRFFTSTLGLRRIKKTVNFDAPDVYHLYYGNEVGTPGTVMTYFPFPGMPRGRPGVGEVGTTAFSVPAGSLDFWQERLSDAGVAGLEREVCFGEQRLKFSGPDGDGFALAETEKDDRAPWTEGGVTADGAIRGFHSASLRLDDGGATEELLKFMGYEEAEQAGNIRRLAMSGGNGADFIDIEALPDASRAHQGAGSVHHIAFAVKDDADQIAVREALVDTGSQVTPVIDRDYFHSIYFRTPGGVLFEVATNRPGFDRDEDVGHLGEALQLPRQHAHLRPYLEEHLPPIGE